MWDQLADLLMDADIGADIRPGILGVVGRLVDGSGLKVEDLSAKTGITMEHAAALLGNRSCALSIRSIDKALRLFGMRVRVTVE